MSAQTVDPFDLDTEYPPRDRWGRPLLIPAKGGERIAFTRMSTLANYICDQSGLATWEKRLLARGLAQREDLAAMIAALPPLHSAKRDKRDLSAAEKREDKEISAKLDGYINEALEHAGRSFKANAGTAIHGFTDPGADLDQVPERMRPDVDSFMTYVGSGKAELLATEVFVVNDDLNAAGSFDHIGRLNLPGFSQPCIIDKKTGQVDGKGLSFAIQLAGYATSQVYDLDTDERRPLESLTSGERVTRKYGFIAHIPLGAGRTDFYRIDLARGIHCARLATNVRTARSLDGLMARVEEKDFS